MCTKPLSVILHIEKPPVSCTDPQKLDQKSNIQVAYYLSGQQTIEREFGAFKPISDASPKYVLSMDRLDFSRDGISHINIVDFLLGKKEIMLT